MAGSKLQLTTRRWHVTTENRVIGLPDTTLRSRIKVQSSTTSFNTFELGGTVFGVRIEPDVRFGGVAHRLIRSRLAARTIVHVRSTTLFGSTCWEYEGGRGPHSSTVESCDDV